MDERTITVVTLDGGTITFDPWSVKEGWTNDLEEPEFLFDADNDGGYTDSEDVTFVLKSGEVINFNPQDNSDSLNLVWDMFQTM